MAGVYAVWLVAWVFTTPLFSAADEWAHYLRALGIREGRLIGERVSPGHVFEGFSQAQQDFLRQTSRVIDIPAGMAPQGYACNAFQPEQSAGCARQATARPDPAREPTVTGAYPPAFYLLPAAAMLPTVGPAPALFAARLITSLTCALLLLLALLALAEARALESALAAFTLALTPLGLATMAGLSPSGPEIAAGLTFAVGLSQLAAREEAGARAWWACVAGGVAVTLARPLGAAWVVLHLGVFFVLSGRERLVQLARHQRRRAVMTGLALVGAMLLNRLWEAFHGARVPVSLLPEMKAWREAFKHYPEWLREQVGVFQYLDAKMPEWAYIAWGALLAGLVVWQWPRLSSTWRWRAGVMALCILAVPLGLYATVVRNSEFWLQGRYVLPMTCALPLLFGAGRPREGVAWTAGWRRVCVALAGGASVLQLVAWYANARRSAVGTRGPWLFFSSAEWHPPLGWEIWTVIAIACAMALPLCVWLAGRDTSPARAAER
jgi:hypothetical protein